MADFTIRITQRVAPGQVELRLRARTNIEVPPLVMQDIYVITANTPAALTYMVDNTQLRFKHEARAVAYRAAAVTAGLTFDGDTLP